MEKIDELKFKMEKAIENSLSMAGAARVMGINYKTFRFYAKKFGLFKPNQCGKGIYNINLNKVFRGERTISKSTLKKRIIDDNIFDYKCDICKINSWNGTAITLELDHIDGNKTNNKIENLRLLCPNCHSQTPTYRANNKIFMDKKIIESELKNSCNLTQLCKRLGLSHRGKETKLQLEKILGYEIIFDKLI